MEASAFRAPKQKRSRRTLERILVAARELLAERGADGASVQEIVARAGSSVGSFYARFDGKDDLLDYLERRVWEEARERWDRAVEERAWDELDLQDLVPGVVRVLLDVGRHEAEVRQALRLRRGSTGPSEPVRDFLAHIRRGIRALLLSHASEMAHPDPPEAVEVGIRVVAGGLRELEAWGELSDEAIVREVSGLLLGYLGTAPSLSAPDVEAMDFFDVWA